MLTETQKLLRTSGLGGSDIAAIAGVSNYKSALQVYLEKIGVSNNDDHENEYIWWGNELEPLLMKRYSQVTGNLVSTESTFIKSEQYPWMIGNVDGWIIKNGKVVGILECKTANSRTAHKWGEPGTNEIPDEYLLQCMHYAIISNLAFVDVAVKIDSADFRIYTYHRDLKMEEEIIELERQFWNEHVIPQVPPQVQSTNDAKALWPLAKSMTQKVASAHVITALQELKTLKEVMEEAQKEEDRLKAILQVAMEDKECLIDGHGQILATWKNQETTRLDTKQLKELDPDLFEEFSITTTSRVLRLKKIGVNQYE